MKDYYIAWVCSCCMIAAVNGEPCTCDEEALHTSDFSHPAGLMGKIEELATPGLLNEHHECGISVENLHTVECGCEERSFSWSSCDGCGSTMGGERYAFTVWLD